MSKLITPHTRIEHVEHTIDFEDSTCPGAGYSFPADKTGIDFAELHDCAIDNLLSCYTRADISGPFYSAREWSYMQAAVYRCKCGGEIVCESPYGNDCNRCNGEFNQSGQRLAPREFWGEETGESYSDIVNGNEDNEWMDS
jgi:hypothetical protein